MIKKIDEFRMPAEWEPQKSVWIAWPHNKNDWPGLFEKIPNVVGKIIKYLTKDQKKLISCMIIAMQVISNLNKKHLLEIV